MTQSAGGRGASQTPAQVSAVAHTCAAAAATWSMGRISEHPTCCTAAACLDFGEQASDQLAALAEPL